MHHEQPNHIVWRSFHSAFLILDVVLPPFCPLPTLTGSTGAEQMQLSESCTHLMLAHNANSKFMQCTIANRLRPHAAALI